jgi:membrane-bound serine protease (ClpP class)
MLDLSRVRFTGSFLAPSRTSLLRTLLIAFLTLSPSFIASAQSVHVITLDATINPATADYIHQSIAKATEEKAECLIIALNTPGGLLKSTRIIVSDLLTAKIPVVVYVSPAGAQAASAGTFIALAAHVAAMTPGTNIGAAHPVGMQGGEPDSISSEKATNDAAAFIRSISEKRHRNVKWAEEAVRKSTSLTETEALRDSVIDLIAPSLDSLVSQLDGRAVQLDSGPDTIRTAGAQVIQKKMDWKSTLLDLLSDPNIAYIFFLLGIYGLMFELYNPGSVLPGVVGVISLILAFYSLHTLPVNYAGLALIVVGIILFLLEIKITSYGLLTVGGAICLFLGSVMLIDVESPLEVLRVSWVVIIPSVAVTVLFFLFAIGMGVKAQRRKPTTGQEGLIGEEGVAIENLTPDGQVRVHGELWSATTTAPPVRKGEPVIVTGVHGLHLTVRPTQRNI